MLTNSPALGPWLQKEAKKQMGIVKALHDYMRYRKRRWDTLVSKATTKEILTFLNGKGPCLAREPQFDGGFTVRVQLWFSQSRGALSKQ
jgi:hypothetical protein